MSTARPRRMRVLEIQGQVEGGGSEVHTLLLAKGLRERGHEVVLAVPESRHPMVEEIERAEFPVATFRAVPAWRGIVDLSAALRVKAFIAEHRVDIVHSHLWNADVMGLVGGRLAGVPVVTTLHGPTLNVHVRRDLRVRTFLRLMSSCIRRMDRRIAISEFVRDYISRDLQIPEAMIDVVHNASDYARYQRVFDRNAIRRSLAVDPAAPVVSCIGVLNDQKRPFLFLEAARRILDEVPECRFLWIGRGPLLEAARSLASSLHLDQSMLFLGYRPDVPELLAATDVLAFTPRDEGFGRVMTEAMASGVPVVAFDSGACREVVANEVTGFIVPDLELKRFSGCCVRLLRDMALRQRMGVAARERARTHFDVPGFVEQTEALIADTLQVASGDRRDTARRAARN